MSFDHTLPMSFDQTLPMSFDQALSMSLACGKHRCNVIMTIPIASSVESYFLDALHMRVHANIVTHILSNVTVHTHMLAYTSICKHI